jgi:hypothetical protein
MRKNGVCLPGQAIRQPGVDQSHGYDKGVGRLDQARCTTMRKQVWNRLRFVVMLAAGCWLFEGGCLGFVQEQIEVVGAPFSNNPHLVISSWVFQRFGPEILKISDWFN